MEPVWGTEIDPHPEGVFQECLKVDKRHHTDGLIEFNDEIDIAPVFLFFPGVRTENADLPDMKPVMELILKSPHLSYNIRLCLHLPDGLFAVLLYERCGGTNGNGPDRCQIQGFGKDV